MITKGKRRKLGGGDEDWKQSGGGSRSAHILAQRGRAGLEQDPNKEYDSQDDDRHISGFEASETSDDDESRDAETRCFRVQRRR